jgi:hypothetical protein
MKIGIIGAGEIGGTLTRRLTAPWKEQVLGVLAKKCAGIHLLRGEPGTGKTSFIRYLVEVLRTTHRFYFLPSYEYARVGSRAEHISTFFSSSGNAYGIIVEHGSGPFDIW